MTTTQKKDKALVPIGDESLALAADFAEQINLLAMPTPSQYIKQRQGRGGKVFDYVEFNYIVARLNATFRYDWDVEVIEQQIYKEARQVATKICLTVRFADGRVVKKTAWGGADVKTRDNRIIDIADDLKASEADAIKKAASLLGICWDVYSGYSKNGDNGDKKKDADDESIVDGEEVIDVSDEGAEGGDIADLATNPDEDKKDREKIAGWIRLYCESKTIDYQAFKIFLSVNTFTPPRQFTGKKFGNVSLSEGKLEDLRYLKSNIDKFIDKYIELQSQGDE